MPSNPLAQLKRVLELTYDPLAGTIAGSQRSERRLSEMADVYADKEALAVEIARGDRFVYSVETIETKDTDGDLHYGLARVMPGRVGDEFFMTRGHYHAWRQAAELYVGLSGDGVMLMEDEAECRAVRLAAGTLVYVPGHTAHRTINVGSEPLVYLGVYPARAGHDYGALAERGFSRRVIANGAGGWKLE